MKEQVSPRQDLNHPSPGTKCQCPTNESLDFPENPLKMTKSVTNGRFRQRYNVLMENFQIFLFLKSSWWTVTVEEDRLNTSVSSPRAFIRQSYFKIWQQDQLFYLIHPYPINKFILAYVLSCAILLRTKSSSFGNLVPVG